MQEFIAAYLRNFGDLSANSEAVFSCFLGVAKYIALKVLR